MNVYPGVVLPLVFPVCQGIHNVPMNRLLIFPQEIPSSRRSVPQLIIVRDV